MATHWIPNPTTAVRFGHRLPYQSKVLMVTRPAWNRETVGSTPTTLTKCLYSLTVKRLVEAQENTVRFCVLAPKCCSVQGTRLTVNQKAMVRFRPASPNLLLWRNWNTQMAQNHYNCQFESDEEYHINNLAALMEFGIHTELRPQVFPVRVRGAVPNGRTSR